MTKEQLMFGIVPHTKEINLKKVPENNESGKNEMHLEIDLKNKSKFYISMESNVYKFWNVILVLVCIWSSIFYAY